MTISDAKYNLEKALGDVDKGRLFCDFKFSVRGDDSELENIVISAQEAMSKILWRRVYDAAKKFCEVYDKE